eukprot:3546035-Rhodomonas_salina.1
MKAKKRLARLRAMAKRDGKVTLSAISQHPLLSFQTRMLSTTFVCLTFFFFCAQPLASRDFPQDDVEVSAFEPFVQAAMEVADAAELVQLKVRFCFVLGLLHESRVRRHTLELEHGFPMRNGRC